VLSEFAGDFLTSGPWRSFSGVIKINPLDVAGHVIKMKKVMKFKPICRLYWINRNKSVSNYQSNLVENENLQKILSENSILENAFRIWQIWKTPNNLKTQSDTTNYRIYLLFYMFDLTWPWKDSARLDVLCGAELEYFLKAMWRFWWFRWFGENIFSTRRPNE